MTGGTDQEINKMDKVEPDTFPEVSVEKPTIDAGQKAVNAAPYAHRSVRFKRASGKGKLADRLLYQWGVKKAEIASDPR